ncbi:MAG: hypothetical protein IH908_02015 [Proteobacteria bacterium]|nr:hypothetical protein [Pseudomonadota bacterium]
MSTGRLRHPLRTWLIMVVLSGAWQAAARDGDVMVQTYCAACHSLTLVYSQSGNKQFWRNTIDLMRAKHNLGPIPPAFETSIIDYLAKRAVERPIVRRALLEPAFLPEAR